MDDAIRDALATAGAMAVRAFEISSPFVLHVVESSIPAPILGLAFLMLETDPEYAPRWTAAGGDWMRRGELLREAVLYLLTPEDMPVSAAEVRHERLLEAIAQLEAAS